MPITRLAVTLLAVTVALLAIRAVSIRTILGARLVNSGNGTPLHSGALTAVSYRDLFERGHADDPATRRPEIDGGPVACRAGRFVPDGRDRGNRQVGEANGSDAIRLRASTRTT